MKELLRMLLTAVLVVGLALLCAGFGRTTTTTAPASYVAGIGR